MDQDARPANARVTAPNPFDDLESLRISQDFVGQAAAKKLLTTVPIGKPGKQSFVRTRPEPGFRMDFPCLELREDRELYIVSRDFAPLIPEDVTYRTLFTTMSRQGVLSLWPVRLPSPDGRKNEWHISERLAAEKAATKWIRVQADMNLGANVIYEAVADLGEPAWPAFSYSEILTIAFKSRAIIDSFEHPAMKLLRGAV
jgi:hypothetical protein